VISKKEKHPIMSLFFYGESIFFGSLRYTTGGNLESVRSEKYGDTTLE